SQAHALGCSRVRSDRATTGELRRPRSTLSNLISKPRTTRPVRSLDGSPGAAQPRSHRARDRQRDGRTWIAPGHREQRADCWPGLGPILSTLGTLPALTRPRATFLGWSSKSAAVAALASGIRIQGRELKKVPEPSGIRSRQPGNAWYDEIR